MMELRSVVKTYASQKNGAPFRALDGISTSFRDGELTIILGPSGSGKSTLLRLLNRMIEPDSGEILIDGKSSTSIDRVELRRRPGYVIQNVGLFPHMSVASNIAVVPSLLAWKKERIRARVAELLDLVSLPQNFAERRPHQLSGGEAQRVGVARALAADPHVLLMDEPFGALDARTRENLQAEFIRIQKELKKTVIFVTHDVAEAVHMADTILVMKDGRLSGTGTPRELARNFKDSFVREFLGNRLELELLGRVLARERADFSLEAENQAKDLCSITDAMHADATLYDAFAQMLATTSTEIAISGTNGKCGLLKIENIVRDRAGTERKKD